MTSYCYIGINNCEYIYVVVALFHFKSETCYKQMFRKTSHNAASVEYNHFDVHQRYDMLFRVILYMATNHFLKEGTQIYM